MHRYASVLAEFEREVPLGLDQPTFSDTKVWGDSSFASVKNATFLVWDEQLAADVLGEAPRYEFIFELPEPGHEGPVYIEESNQIFFSRIARGYLPQLVIDLNGDEPVLTEYMAKPPVYAPSGARYRDGLIYYAACGGNESLDGRTYYSGLYTFDPKTMESKVLLNNYYGFFFDGIDDLDLDHEGRIWFTDNLLARNAGSNTRAPQLGAASYMFDPTTGAVSVVEDTLEAPNGISFSPDKKILYITDSSAGVPMIDPTVPWEQAGGLGWNNTYKRTLYAFDVSEDGLILKNRRPIFVSMDFAPDGLKVAANGYLLTASGHGIDVLHPSGRPILRVQTEFLAVNIEFAGPDRDELWIVGHGGVARVKWGLTGQKP
ncbi:putative gluconolactonase precursor [Lophiotrema nucula]|uniref:Putative gluconolactonase n=1 Tax=Lophiotrema nucula TaxID=690887 RepID=A0A6A5YNS5_9PLEO|nr:putative gluconolactonase precursor [Lophiotrema nucula]